MKTFLIIVALCILFSCEFTKAELMTSKKLSSGIEVNVYYWGGGATAPDVIEIRKVVNNHDSVLTRLDGLTKGYTAQVTEVNDTSVLITLIDTASIKKFRIRYFIHLFKGTILKEERPDIEPEWRSIKDDNL